MEEFDKIKAFSESVAERQANLSEAASEENTDKASDEEAPVLDFPKYLSQFRPQVTEDKSGNGLLFWTVGGLVFLLLAGVGGFFYFYAPQEDAVEIFEIRPTPTPVKVRPENPGGLQIAGTDKVVYDRTSVHKAEVMEKLFPEPEQPVAPPAEQVMPVEEILPPVPQETEIIPEGTEDVMAVVSPEIPEDSGAPAEQPVISEPVVQEQKTTEDPEPEPKAEPAVVVPKEIWRAQLLSSSSKSKVETAWKGILKKHAALLSDMPYQVVPVEISGKGTFYRLQVGDFAKKDMVMNLCEKLKKKKQDCIPVKADK